MRQTTITGRFVSGPALQNIPLRTEEGKRIRDAFMGIKAPQASQGVHHLISWVDTGEDPISWPPHPQLLGYWKDRDGAVQEEGKDTLTSTVHMTALVAVSSVLHGPSSAMDLLRELNWTPIRLLAVLTRPAGWYPDKGGPYKKPLWVDGLGRNWAGSD